MDEFEQAVLCSYDPSISGEVKLKAIEYCNNVRNAREGWVFCIDKFYQATRIEVKFFCLQVFQDLILHKYGGLSDSERVQLKSGLWKFLTEVIPKTNAETPLKNKYAQVLALLFRVEYPQLWPSFLSDLINCLSLGTNVIDMFIRVMKSIDEEVVSREVQRSTVELAHNTEIKDYMRDHGIKEVVQAWYNILITYGTTAPQLANECLDNLKRYISWIDITLVVNNTVLPLLFKFMETNNQLRENSCECVQEIVKKGMDPVAKLSLLNKLNIFQVLNKVSLEDDVEYLEVVSLLINSIGEEILIIMEKLPTMINEGKATVEIATNAQGLLEETLVYIFRFMNHPDDDVSMTVFDSATMWLKSVTNLTPKNIEHLTLLLQIIRNRLRFQDNYDFTKQGEEEAEKKEYRNELLSIYKNVCRLSPQMVANFVHSTLTTAIANFDKLTYADVEASLQLLYVMGEEQTIKNMESFYSQMITILAASNLSTYPHPAVSLVYFDVIVRYARFFPPDPDVLRNILISFLDGRGIRHPHVTVRSRVCYLFQRIIKSQLKEFVPFLPSILQSLKEFLIVGPDVRAALSLEDQLNLFDALGLLIGAHSNPTEQRKFLEDLLLPLMKQGQEILVKELYKTDTPEKPFFTNILLQIITVIGTFSKGFNGQPGESGQVFKQSLEFVISVYRPLANNEEVRTKVIFFLHRMVDCLNVDVLPYATTIINELLATSGIKDLCELIRLINQLMAKFKERMFSVVDEVLLKLLDKIFGFISELSRDVTRVNLTPISDIERDILELQKIYYSFLNSLALANLVNVLRSPVNAPSLNNVIKTIIEGCTVNPDMTAVKTCYSIMKKLIEQWTGNDPNTSLPGFTTYILSDVIPVLLKQPFKPEFELNDATAAQTVSELIQMQMILYTKTGKQFSDYMRTVVLPSLQCPPQVIDQYIIQLESNNQKQFKTFYTQFVTSFKKRPS